MVCDSRASIPSNQYRPQRKPPALFPIFLQYCSTQSVAHFCILPLTAYANFVRGALLRKSEETQASVDEPRGRASERGEGYMFRAKLRKKMVRPEQRRTGCSDRQQTFQTVTARLGDLGEPNVPRGTLGSAKSARRDNRPSSNGDLTVRWTTSKIKRPSPTVFNGGSPSHQDGRTI